MAALDVTGLLAPGLLGGVGVLVAGPSTGDAPTLGAAVRHACTELGARVCSCEVQAHDEGAIDTEVRQAGAVDLLVLDGSAVFSGVVAADAHKALRACLDGTWNVTRAAINHAFLGRGRGGRIVYLAPAPDAGELAEAARAGLENLARTLSIEWARHGVNVLAIAPGVGTAASEVAALCAYLASPAGAYFSGCLLDLRGP